MLVAYSINGMIVAWQNACTVQKMNTRLQYHTALCFQMEAPTESMFYVQDGTYWHLSEKEGEVYFDLKLIKNEVLQQWQTAKWIAVHTE